MRDFIQQCGRAVTSAVAPSWARWLLARAAIAPPIWKTPLFERVCASLVRNSLGATEDVIVTNFGLGANLRCLIGMSKTAYAFGKFDHMLSERATFTLVRNWHRTAKNSSMSARTKEPSPFSFTMTIPSCSCIGLNRIDSLRGVSQQT